MPFEKRILPLAVLIELFLGFECGGFQLVLIDIAGDYELNNASMGALVTVQFIASTFVPLLFGHFSDRRGKKKVIQFFLPFLILGCAIIVFTDTVVPFCVGIFCIGVGYGISESLISAALSDNDPDKAEKTINMAQSFFSIGAVSGPFIVLAFMNKGADWSVAFLITGICFLVLYPLLCVTRFHKKPIVNAGENPGQGQSGFLLLKNKVFIIFVSSIFVYGGLEVGFSYFTGAVFEEKLQAPALSAFGISFFWLAMAASRLAVALAKANTKKLVIILYGPIVAVLILLAVSGSAGFAVLLYAIAGALLGPIWPTLMGMATRRFTDHSGTVSGMMMAGSNSAGMIMPIVIGFMFDKWNIPWTLCGLSLLAVIGIVLFVWIHKTEKARNFSVDKIWK